MSARILIVDDLAPNRNLLEVKLAAEYYDVLTASGGQEALDIAQRENPVNFLRRIPKHGIFQLLL